MSHNCSKCRFWETGFNNEEWRTGDCRRRAPISYAATYPTSHVMRVFPHTSGTDWCGEFEQTDAERPKALSWAVVNNRGIVIAFRDFKGDAERLNDEIGADFVQQVYCADPALEIGKHIGDIESPLTCITCGTVRGLK